MKTEARRTQKKQHHKAEDSENQAKKGVVSKGEKRAHKQTVYITSPAGYSECCKLLPDTYEEKGYKRILTLYPEQHSLL